MIEHFETISNLHHRLEKRTERYGSSETTYYIYSKDNIPPEIALFFLMHPNESDTYYAGIAALESKLAVMPSFLLVPMASMTGSGMEYTHNGFFNNLNREIKPRTDDEEAIILKKIVTKHGPFHAAYTFHQDYEYPFYLYHEGSTEGFDMERIRCVAQKNDIAIQDGAEDDPNDPALGYYIKNGLVRQHAKEFKDEEDFDGTLETFMIYMGTPVVMTFETPYNLKREQAIRFTEGLIDNAILPISQASIYKQQVLFPPTIVNFRQ